jgi:hypothetical protein
MEKRDENINMRGLREREREKKVILLELFFIAPIFWEKGS